MSAKNGDVSRREPGISNALGPVPFARHPQVNLDDWGKGLLLPAARA